MSAQPPAQLPIQPPSKKCLTFPTKSSFHETETLGLLISHAGVNRRACLRQGALTGQIQPPVVVPSINEQQRMALGRLGVSHPKAMTDERLCT
jgi:hypothetical protein